MNRKLVAITCAGRWRRQVMLIKFSELPIAFGAVLIDTEGNRWLLRSMGESVGCSS